MEEVSADNPPPNGFAIPEDQVYAGTDFEMWEVIEFLVTKLEPAKREDLDPDDRFCSICRQDFGDSENVELSETPVKTVCGHLFGKYCITKWLDPLCCWGLTERAEPLDLEIFTDIFEDGKESCPTCRRVFFSKTPLEPMEALAARLWLWDNAYAFAGVARSPKEERTRNILWEHVNYCRSIDQFKLDGKVRFEILEGAQLLLLDFARGLKSQALTPHQESLRQTLERLGGKNLREMVHVVEDGSRVSYVFHGEGKSESEPEPDPEHDSESTNVAVRFSNSEGNHEEMEVSMDEGEEPDDEEIEAEEAGDEGMELDEVEEDEGEGDEVS